MKKEDKNHELGKHVLQLYINGKQHDWTKQYISGAEIRKLGNIPHTEEVFLAIKRPWEDEPIALDTKVNLARPEIESFYSKEKRQKFELIVNGRLKTWAEINISFEEVVVLAFGSYINNPDKVYTVTYDKGPNENPDGIMDKGDKVVVKIKMIFNVTCTDKS